MVLQAQLNGLPIDLASLFFETRENFAFPLIKKKRIVRLINKKLG
jgi:hypothetical protein